MNYKRKQYRNEPNCKDKGARQLKYTKRVFWIIHCSCPFRLATVSDPYTVT